ncbi:LOW QUALITY PROTEIN: cuticle protein LPCP-23-like [Uloborus diversus]|uniref:LOW QUALITY PROTEIN: cuticle protein LPCP-23-like n=1 Tax=Uloborus diversus TaxID=327109 RepID=UPI002409B6E5|nr:LOW QUALITY PROTEIN: cuticle protein LPCP-23-like [Uloborus diversus]
MYKLVVLFAALAICSATVVVPSAYHYLAPHSAAKVTKVEWEHKPISYVVPAVAPVAPLVTYSHAKTLVHHAPLLHAPPVVHHAPALLHAPLVHAPVVHAAPLLHAPAVVSSHTSTTLLHKKA